MTKKNYEVVAFAYSDCDMNIGLGGASHYSGTSKEKADAAFKCVCELSEIKTRHMRGLKMKPILVTESEINAEEYDEYDHEKTCLQYKLFKDHAYEKEEKEEN